MEKSKSSIIALVIDLLIITFSFFFVIWLKPATIRFYLPNYIKPFIGFSFTWLLLSLIGHKYRIAKKKYVEIIAAIFRINLVVLVIILALIYIFNRFTYSRLIVFGTYISSFILELFSVFIYYIHNKNKKGFDTVNKLTFKPRKIKNKKADFVRVKFPVLPETKNNILRRIKEKKLVKNIKLQKFMLQYIPLEKIPHKDSLIINTHTLFNLKDVDVESLLLLINFHKVNDFKRINGYFSYVNSCLKKGGFFVGDIETIKERQRSYYEKFPAILAFPFYLIDFIYMRIFPKLPILKDIYFFISQGNNRALSKAEILGRLSFCGFQIVDEREIDNRLYFIVQKAGEPRDDKNPSYGPLIKMKRVGKDGELFNIFKLRTMHPYSEYIQDYIHRKYDIEDKGKFKNDFRITSWGKVFRKMWLDELPQLLNFFRGELSIVGVRALSKHYFNLYPAEIQKLRTKFKPGLVPPYYADMPESFEEILESEKRYILARENHPVSTQIKYFFKAMYNIIFKKARSK